MFFSSSQVSVPFIVPSEFRKDDVTVMKPELLKKWQHPITGTTRLFVVGDRFHTATEPHKSPLCDYHDIRLCEQANTIKTSYQESENHRKNFLRLRSSTMQNVPVHFMYNYLMDYYQNELIVEKQILQLKKNLEPGHEITRDIYKRFPAITTTNQCC